MGCSGPIVKDKWPCEAHIQQKLLQGRFLDWTEIRKSPTLQDPESSHVSSWKPFELSNVEELFLKGQNELCCISVHQFTAMEMAF